MQTLYMYIFMFCQLYVSLLDIRLLRTTLLVMYVCTLNLIRNFTVYREFSNQDCF